MNRRGFFKFLGAASAAVAPVALAPWAPPLVPLEPPLKMIKGTNPNDVLIPKLWAEGAMRDLENCTVMRDLVHRDYTSQIARCRDRVNIVGRCGTGS